MELEDLKYKWQDWGGKEKNLTPLSKEKLVLVTRRKYKYNFIKILIPELIIGGLHLFGALFLFLFFSFFERTLHASMASVVIVLFIAIPIMSIFAFVQYYRSGNVNVSLSQQIKSLNEKGKQFLKLQYFLVVLRIMLLSNCVVLFPLLYSENLSTSQVFISIVIGTTIILFLSYKIWRYYKKRVQHIEELIKSLI